MRSSSLKEGDLVYIPQSVRLFLYRDRSVSQFMMLKLPRHVLVTETSEHNDLVGVLYDGETWHVKLGDIYPMQECAE